MPPKKKPKSKAGKVPVNTTCYEFEWYLDAEGVLVFRVGKDARPNEEYIVTHTHRATKCTSTGRFQWKAAQSTEAQDALYFHMDTLQPLKYAVDPRMRLEEKMHLGFSHCYPANGESPWKVSTLARKFFVVV